MKHNSNNILTLKVKNFNELIYALIDLMQTSVKKKYKFIEIITLFDNKSNLLKVDFALPLSKSDFEKIISKAKLYGLKNKEILFYKELSNNKDKKIIYIEISKNDTLNIDDERFSNENLKNVDGILIFDENIKEFTYLSKEEILDNISEENKNIINFIQQKLKEKRIKFYKYLTDYLIASVNTTFNTVDNEDLEFFNKEIKQYWEIMPEESKKYYKEQIKAFISKHSKVNSSEIFFGEANGEIKLTNAGKEHLENTTLLDSYL